VRAAHRPRRRGWRAVGRRRAPFAERSPAPRRTPLQASRRFAAPESCPHHDGDGRDVALRKRAVDAGNGAAYVGNHPGGISRRAKLEREKWIVRPVDLLDVRSVRPPLYWLRQGVVPDVGDHADDRRRHLRVEVDHASNGISLAEVEPRRGLVEDGDAGRLRIVVHVDVASAQEGSICRPRSSTARPSRVMRAGFTRRSSSGVFKAASRRWICRVTADASGRAVLLPAATNLTRPGRRTPASPRP
jgi:hypothetical protein